MKTNRVRERLGGLPSTATLTKHKLSAAQAGERYTVIARSSGVMAGAVKDIGVGRTWGSVTGQV